MRKYISFSISIISVFLIILSCRKEFTEYFEGDISDNDIESTKIFHSQNASLTPRKYRKNVTLYQKNDNRDNKPFFKIAPIWRKAKKVITGNSELLIIVPTKENELINKEFSVRRFFLFKSVNGIVQNGQIVEFLATQSLLKNNVDNIIEKFQKGQLGDFSGAIMRYDMNYFPIDGKVYENGKVKNRYSQLVNLPKFEQSSTNGLFGTASASNGSGSCYELYWCYGNANPGDAGCTFLGYSESCWDSPGGGSGSDSGYDSSSNQGGGGGGPYGGNTPLVPRSDAEFIAKIDDSQLVECMKKMLNEAVKLNGAIPSLIRNFSVGTPGYNWTLKNGALSPNQNGSTGSYNSTTMSVTTTIDNSKFVGSSDLSILRTILHEGVHAYLVSFFRNDPINANKEYSQMVDEWMNAKKPNLNDIQHNEFVRSVINQLASDLQSYGDSNGYQFGSNFEKVQFYQDLAWGGLTGTNAFQALTAQEKDRILNVLAIEQTGKDMNGNAKPIKGKNGGC